MNIGIIPGVIIITLIEAEIFHKHLYKCWYQTTVMQRLIIPTCYLPLTFVKDIFLITKLSWKHRISISKRWYRKQSFTRSPEYSFVSHHDVMKTSFSIWGIMTSGFSNKVERCLPFMAPQSAPIFVHWLTAEYKWLSTLFYY